jgi:hypothetical protein
MVAVLRYARIGVHFSFVHPRSFMTIAIHPNERAHTRHGARCVYQGPVVGDGEVAGGYRADQWDFINAVQNGDRGIL